MAESTADEVLELVGTMSVVISFAVDIDEAVLCSVGSLEGLCDIELKAKGTLDPLVKIQPLVDSCND